MLGTVKLFLIAVIVIFIGAGFWYVTNLKADLATSEANNQKLQDSVNMHNYVLERIA